MDRIEGDLLIDIIRSGKSYELDVFYRWLETLCGSMHGYHRAKKECFRDLTPYTIIIDGDNRAHLLDLHARSNQEIKEINTMDKVRERFVSNQIKNYNNKYQADYYSTAKTIQFILSVVQFEPNISKKEIKKFKRIISACESKVSKKTYQNFRELQSEFKNRGDNKKHSRLFIMVPILCVLILLTYFI